MKSLSEPQETFIAKFEEAFQRDINGRFDLTKTLHILEYWNTYGDMLISRAQVKTFSFPPFTDNNTMSWGM